MKRNSKSFREDFRHRFWVAIGYLGAAVAIGTFLFQQGHRWGYRDAKKQEFKAFITYLSEMKDGIGILDLQCDKQEVERGDKCILTVKIQNRNAYECDLWLGATIRDNEGSDYWNTSEDRLFTVSPSGITTISRQFTIPVEARPGLYDLRVNLWYGKTSDPSHSERISTALVSGQIKVSAKPAGNKTKKPSRRTSHENINSAVSSGS